MSNYITIRYMELFGKLSVLAQSSCPVYNIDTELMWKKKYSQQLVSNVNIVSPVVIHVSVLLDTTSNGLALWSILDT